MPFLGTGLLLALLIAAPLIHRRWRQARAAKKLTISTPSGIVDERFVRIGGLEQWISIRGEDRGNPALLFIHGGPGASYRMFKPIMRAWEKHFTVVQWDQPGAGQTFARHGKAGTGKITFERLTRDGIEVAEHVRQRLGQQKVILVGSSLGSLVALRMAQARPELFSAYIGTDQNVGAANTHPGAHQATIEKLRALGKTKGAAVLERLGDDRSRWRAKDWTTVSKWTMAADPATDATKTLLGPSVWFAPGMSLGDMRRELHAMEFANEELYQEFPTANAWLIGTRYQMPFYIFQGDGDVLTPPDLAARFFTDVEAPVKEMALIAGAGHFAAFTQPEQFHKLLVERVRPLAASAK